MFRFRLRTLLIVLAIGPPVIALAWWYGRLIIAVLVITLLVAPSLIFDVVNLSYYSIRAIRRLIDGSPREESKESD
jgi:hypothetical protein